MNVSMSLYEIRPFADVLMPVDADHFIVNEHVLKLDYSFDDSEKDERPVPDAFLKLTSYSK